MFSFFLLALMLSPFTAGATSPCVSLTPEQFQAVKDDSDLIIHVQVLGSFNSKTSEQSITWVRILNAYKGKVDSDVIKVKWISYNPPLYSYKKDSEVVLLLKQKEGDWYLTDDSWKKYVPAVIGLPAEFPIKWMGKAYTREEFINARLNPPLPEDYATE